MFQGCCAGLHLAGRREKVWRIGQERLWGQPWNDACHFGSHAASQTWSLSQLLTTREAGTFLWSWVQEEQELDLLSTLSDIPHTQKSSAPESPSFAPSISLVPDTPDLLLAPTLPGLCPRLGACFLVCFALHPHTC